MPLTPAWEVGVHKCQEQTLDHVKVDLGNIFESRNYFNVKVKVNYEMSNDQNVCWKNGGPWNSWNWN